MLEWGACDEAQYLKPYRENYKPRGWEKQIYRNPLLVGRNDSKIVMRIVCVNASTPGCMCNSSDGVMSMEGGDEIEPV